MHFAVQSNMVKVEDRFKQLCAFTNLTRLVCVCDPGSYARTPCLHTVPTAIGQLTRLRHLEVTPLTQCILLMNKRHTAGMVTQVLTPPALGSASTMLALPPHKQWLLHSAAGVACAERWAAGSCYGAASAAEAGGVGWRQLPAAGARRPPPP